MDMLQVSPDQVKYSIIFAHVCISIIHQICSLSITMKASSYELIVLFQGYKNIFVQYTMLSTHIVQSSFYGFTKIESY